MAATRARIATIAQGGKRFRTFDQNRDFLMGLLDEALREKPDLVCLPEAFTCSGVKCTFDEKLETLPGPTTDAAARRAREHRCYVICPVEVKIDGRGYNVAAILDRQGQICGVYRKVSPVTTTFNYTLFEGGIMPGSELPVFDLDFGRIAVQICFDAGFPEQWRTLAERGARAVFWPSAYDGGTPLWTYAWLHHFYVISSVRSGKSRIIDPCGEIMLESEARPSVIHRDINLDFVVSHLDWNLAIPDRIAARYGERVDVRRHDRGCGHFIVEPVDPSITTRQLQEEFGFESSAQYHQRHREAQQRMREGKTPEPQKALHGDRPEYSK
jgi:beta-ureidopropionase